MYCRILLDFSVFAQAESATTLLAANVTIKDDLVFIDTWEKNRKGLHDTMEQLLQSKYSPVCSFLPAVLRKILMRP